MDDNEDIIKKFQDEIKENEKFDLEDEDPVVLLTIAFDIFLFFAFFIFLIVFSPFICLHFKFAE